MIIIGYYQMLNLNVFLKTHRSLRMSHLIHFSL